MRKTSTLLLALALVLSLGLATGVPVWADDTGAKYPAAVCTSSEDPYDDVDWTNPGNVTADDGDCATAVIPGKGYTYVLRLTDFGFSIPAGATINGVRVEVRRYANGGNNLRDGLVQLTKDGTTGVGSNKAIADLSWPSAPANQEYGGGTDLWETTWTAAEINSATFGVLFAAYNNHGARSRTAYVDSIRITVYYIFEAVTYSIKGTILLGTGGLENVSVAATGGHTETVYTDGDGEYELPGVANGATNIVITPTLAGHTFTPTDITVYGPVTGDVDHRDFAATATVTTAAIPGVTAPITGRTAVTAITETAQYTGSVTWAPDDDPFLGEVAYTATITLTARTGFTFEGVAEDFFTVAGATTVTNAADSGVVKAIFPATDPVTSVTTQAASATGADSAILSMSYTVGNYSPVDVSFAYKKSTDTAWTYTAWVSKTEDGTHAVTLTGLDSGTLYDFKA